MSVSSSVRKLRGMETAINWKLLEHVSAWTYCALSLLSVGAYSSDFDDKKPTNASLKIPKININTCV
jgi:hypothetical protein